MFMQFACASKRIIALGALVALIAATALAVLAGPAAAQVDPGLKSIRQRNPQGHWVERGQVLVPVKADKANYVEHWVLYPDYVYPSATNTAETLVAAGTKSRTLPSVKEFLAQKFPKGSRYVQVISHEFTLPTRLLKTDLTALTKPRLRSIKHASAAGPLDGRVGWLTGAASAACFLAAAALRRRRTTRLPA